MKIPLSHKALFCLEASFLSLRAAAEISETIARYSIASNHETNSTPESSQSKDQNSDHLLHFASAFIFQLLNYGMLVGLGRVHYYKILEESSGLLTRVIEHPVMSRQTLYESDADDNEVIDIETGFQVRQHKTDWFGCLADGATGLIPLLLLISYIVPWAQSDWKVDPDKIEDFATYNWLICFTIGLSLIVEIYTSYQILHGNDNGTNLDRVTEEKTDAKAVFLSFLEKTPFDNSTSIDDEKLKSVFKPIIDEFIEKLNSKVDDNKNSVRSQLFDYIDNNPNGKTQLQRYCAENPTNNTLFCEIAEELRLSDEFDPSEAHKSVPTSRGDSNETSPLLENAEDELPFETLLQSLKEADDLSRELNAKIKKLESYSFDALAKSSQTLATIIKELDSLMSNDPHQRPVLRNNISSSGRVSLFGQKSSTQQNPQASAIDIDDEDHKDKILNTKPEWN